MVYLEVLASSVGTPTNSPVWPLSSDISLLSWRYPLIYLVHHCWLQGEREREMFYLTTHSTHFIYGYMSSDIWLRMILIVRNETRCRHIGYSYRLTARVLLYAPSHRPCYTSHGALALLAAGVVNKVPLMTIVTFLQKSYRSRISSHWATIPACSVVPLIYKQSKKTYSYVSF